MNLFVSALFRGEMLRTDQFERIINSVPSLVQRYREVEKSATYKEYCELDALVHSKEFLAVKKKYQKTAYLDTEEGKMMTRYNRAASSIHVRRYFAILHSDLFKEYFAFIADKEKYAQLQDKEAVKKSISLLKMQLIDQSMTMQSFRSDEKSHAMKDYEQLKEVVGSDEFKARNAFWKNSKRWELTEEYQKECRFKELQKSADIQFFLKTKKEEVEKYEHLDPIYFDDFDWIDMNKSGWKPGFYYVTKDFKSVHSYTNEVQAFNNGNNTETKEGALVISTRKQKVTAPAWDNKKGMVMKTFNYTSDVINNAEKVAVEEGSIVMVKARCSGILDHGIYLRSAKHVPFISLFDFSGLRMHCGLKSNVKEDKGKKELDRWFPLTYMIFTVVWNKEDIIWYINNIEVHRCKNIIPKGEKLYLHMYSFAFESMKFMTEGKLEVDWVRIFKQK